MTPSTSGSLGAVNVTSGSVLADQVEWADTSRARRKGLLGRPDLPVGHGLYLVPCQWIHMFGMRFAIDVLFLDSAGVVIGLHHFLPPNRFSRLVPRSEGVLELPAATLESTGTRLGDTVRFVGRSLHCESTTRSCNTREVTPRSVICCKLTNRAESHLSIWVGRFVER